ncbi:hypothetical protein MSG28_012417 [Choristoneura fumiferana]|uniref:Uncharacterized protein n=1 Tax=Choristoneura fumiferana TaxID=7141 RepID=A0ACC0KD07_CHOFU|nr:hypothetical protein MSG28_012417 [Choristoneura fumiferana]
MYRSMAGGDGKMYDVDLEAEPDMELLDEVTRNPANNLYLLFTRRNSILPQTLTMNNANSITNSNFNANVPTIHTLTKWIAISSRLTGGGSLNLTTLQPLSVSQPWAVVWASFFVSSTSLGAHLVGNAGRELGGQVIRVTGLDPAGPLWNYSRDRIGPSDGGYVECIHTDGGAVGGLGIGTAICDADFFPNGGISQPGCVTNLCNHNRAWELFAATVTYNHLVGRRCATALQITWNTCTGASFHMGNDDLRKSGTGMYRLNTNRNYPY